MTERHVFIASLNDARQPLWHTAGQWHRVWEFRLTRNVHIPDFLPSRDVPVVPMISDYTVELRTTEHGVPLRTTLRDPFDLRMGPRGFIRLTFTCDGFR